MYIIIIKYSSFYFNTYQKVNIYVREWFLSKKKNKFFLFEVLFSSKSSFEIFSSTSEIDFFWLDINYRRIN